MGAPEKDAVSTSGPTGRTASLSGSVRAVSSAVATLRATRAAKVASALSQANRKTGLFTKK